MAFLGIHGLTALPVGSRDAVYRAAAIAAGIFVMAMFLVMFRGARDGESAKAMLRFVLPTMVLSVTGGFLISWLVEWSTGSAHAFFAGGGTEPKVILDLSRIRAHIKREEWDKARAELDRQWALYPGNGDLLREWERFYLDALGAPSGFVDFLEAQMPLLKGEDRAYALLRLAEVNADVLKRQGQAVVSCKRLLSEFPTSPLAEQTRALLDSLTPPSGKP